MRVRKKSGNDIRYTICKCAKCEVVRQCTPDFDFYKTDLFPGALLCENCFKIICKTLALIFDESPEWIASEIGDDNP
jgi:hypothetical protein